MIEKLKISLEKKGWIPLECLKLYAFLVWSMMDFRQALATSIGGNNGGDKVFEQIMENFFWERFGQFL